MDRGVIVAHTATVDRRSGEGVAVSGPALPAIGRALDDGRLTAERLVQHYLDRIEAYDQRGPRINAVINLNPEAVERARELDRERAQGGPRGPLHGIPAVVKDTIDVAGMPTTGGFTALAESRPLRDAAAIRRLHDAGAVIVANTVRQAAQAFNDTVSIVRQRLIGEVEVAGVIDSG
ncbi:MAG: amidase family protein [Spirochaetaceae bacterium]|nr:amidase family protein [Spirochaetaceae bacterium]